MQPLDLAQLLRQSRDAIVARFVAEVQRKDLSPAGLAHSSLVDHIPAFLDEIIAELTQHDGVRFSQDARDSSDTARQHGGQRWSLGYDLEALVREYGVLRHCILWAASEAGATISIGEFDVLAKCLNVGVAEAAVAYASYRDSQLRAERANLEFLAEAGQLLSSSLDYRSTLARLTRLVVPHLADWCAVRLDGANVEQMTIAHVNPAQVEVLREIYRQYPQAADSEGGWQQVMRTGEPLLVTAMDPQLVEARAQDPVHAALLRSIGSCSWLIVPLRVQASVFGTLTLAYSDSGRHYSESDLRVASDLARRASVAVDNARLYDLSQQERSRVEAVTRAKDEFVAVVSHELRTPLNAILGWTRLVRSGSLPESKRAHALEIIERNANAQTQLIADLLDISRIITGKVRINPSQVDFSNIIEIAIEGVRPAAEAKRIRIEVAIEDRETILRADGDRLQQVAWNLLANAVKFSPKDVGVVRVQLRKIDSDIELMVQDNGVGIAPEFLPYVFDSFRQYDASASRRHGGLGVGLSIAKHLVELHGGVIEAYSDGQGKGATMIVRLPVSPLVSTTLGITKVAATKPHEPEASVPAGADGIKVLVVDDEPDARELVAFVLERSGMLVRTAASAAEAMSELTSHEPDVIVSDIGMPDEDGYTLIRNIRTLPGPLRNTPAIALTAFASNEDRTRALVEGFSAHMVKPVEPGTLVAAVIELAPVRSDVAPSEAP